MSTVVCYDDHGTKHSVATKNLLFYPASFGIFIENNHILLIQNTVSNLWHPPGDVLNSGETPTEAVRQQFRRITGMVPDMGPLIFVEDRYVVKEGEGIQLASLYFLLRRPSTAGPSIAEASSEFKRSWFALDELKREKLQFGYEAIRAAELHVKLNVH